MDIFEIAARKKFRFPSNKGELTAEQLWDLPLTGLDATARSVNAELKGITEDSFINVKPDPRKPDLETKLEIVKHVIAVKIQAQNDVAAAKDRAEKRRKLLDALAAQEDKALSSMSKDDILKQLAALDA